MAAHPSRSRIHTDLSGMSRARPALLELRCSTCGYGARCAVPPDRCPMCSGSTWDSLGRTALREWDAMAPLASGR
jgi:predicted Zn-ribbon and HTH transcriptional regulator